MDEMPLQEGQAVKLTIESIGFGGQGIARHESGLVCLVPKTLPGEVVEGRVISVKKRSAKVEPLRVLTPSVDRVEAPCQYFKDCGGCHFQHLPYEKQLVLKTEVLTQHLQQSGIKIDDIVQPVVAAQTPLEYRSRNSFHINVDGFAFVNPLHHSLVNIDSCLCAKSGTNQLLSTLKKAFDSTPKRLRLKMIDLVVRQNSDGSAFMTILIVDDTADIKEIRNCEIVKSLLSMPNVSLHINVRSRLTKKTFGNHFLHLSGSEYLEDKIGNMQVRLAPESFSQIHFEQALKLYDIACTMLDITQEDRIADFYCGNGILSFFLKEKSASVLGVEVNHTALQQAEVARKVNKVKGVSFRAGKCERIIQKLVRSGEHYNKATLNPPRSGCHPDLLRELPNLEVQQLAYISCSPATFARDTKILNEVGYVTSVIQPLDMFPQTYHLEVVGSFCRRD